MSVATYKLPTAGDLAWIEDLVCTVESRLDDVHTRLKAPFDGNPETQAEPATLDYVGGVFLFTRTLRMYADGFIERADQLEEAVGALRDIQEEHETLLPDKEPYSTYVQRRVHQWAKAAEEADETLEYAKARGHIDAS